MTTIKRKPDGKIEYSTDWTTFEQRIRSMVERESDDALEYVNENDELISYMIASGGKENRVILLFYETIDTFPSHQLLDDSQTEPIELLVMHQPYLVTEPERAVSIDVALEAFQHYFLYQTASDYLDWELYPWGVND